MPNNTSNAGPHWMIGLIYLILPRHTVADGIHSSAPNKPRL